MEFLYPGKTGANVVMARSNWEEVFVQKKVGHPVSELDGLLCMWGGACLEGEDPAKCVERETEEEFGGPAAELILDVFARRVDKPRRRVFRHPITNQPHIDQFTFIAVFDPREWDRLQELVYQPGMVKEGAPMFVGCMDVVFGKEGRFFPDHRDVIADVLLEKHAEGRGYGHRA